MMMLRRGFCMRRASSARSLSRWFAVSRVLGKHVVGSRLQGMENGAPASYVVG